LPTDKVKKDSLHLNRTRFTVNFQLFTENGNGKLEMEDRNTELFNLTWLSAAKDCISWKELLCLYLIWLNYMWH